MPYNPNDIFIVQTSADGSSFVQANLSAISNSFVTFDSASNLVAIPTQSIIFVSASNAITASYSLNGGSGGTSLTTGSTYHITSSWASNSSFSLASQTVLSVSPIFYNTQSSQFYTLVVNGNSGSEFITIVPVLFSGSTSPYTASFAYNALSTSNASIAITAISASYAPGSPTVSSSYVATSSWSIRGISSSYTPYADTSSVANYATISGFASTATYAAGATNATTATNATSASYALTIPQNFSASNILISGSLIVLGSSNLSLQPNPGAIILIDVPIVSGSLSLGAEQSYALNVGGYTLLKIYGQYDGTSSLMNTRVVIGNTQTDRLNLIAGNNGISPSSSSFYLSWSNPQIAYGNTSSLLGGPTGWLDVLISGSARKIPYF